jgi:hypothetical protein
MKFAPLEYEELADRTGNLVKRGEQTGLAIGGNKEINLTLALVEKIMKNRSGISVWLMVCEQ